jgi:hypothetical protein
MIVKVKKVGSMVVVCGGTNPKSVGETFYIHNGKPVFKFPTGF